ncbi:hypothetical protein [Streptomyces antibioticus]
MSSRYSRGVGFGIRVPGPNMARASRARTRWETVTGLRTPLASARGSIS